MGKGRRSRSFPLGATVYADGVDFSVYSKSSTAMELLLFDAVDDAEPSRVVALDPRSDRTNHYWHVFVPGLAGGQLYGYRAHGPFDPERGHRFDPLKVLIDPYARAIAVPAGYSRLAAIVPGANTRTAMKSAVVDRRGYNWEGDRPLRRPFAKTIIYEMHVAGFTAHPSSGVPQEKRGTYAGMIEKIPYLVDLGVTAVELLPVFQFDALDAPRGLRNYWGYAPVSFFAPHAGYSSRTDPLGPLDEFRDLVKALHRADIEVILDVVYNHTAEANEEGPTLCLRGLENSVYYLLEQDKARYADYAGTGNTLNANHSVVRRMILDSLHYWAEEMHVDGFRFDLASILSRDGGGKPLMDPPVIWDIDSDPVLAGTKLIAEAWDAGGLYQVGSFAGDIWTAWNGRFRDDVRAFVKGDRDTVRAVAARLQGSPDIFGHQERGPEQSINFVTCHDGFTLNDLVAYDSKHNAENGEDNRDGTDDNRSWNCGAEGPSDDSDVERLRNRQAKNLLALTLLSLGTPMILMGDEMRRTQRGNNNAYCQDNEISWLDWRLLERHDDVRRFLKHLIGYRLHRDFSEDAAALSLNRLLCQARVHWHGVRLNAPDWGGDSHAVAATIESLSGRITYYLILNAFWEALDFELPHPMAGEEGWRRLMDTGLDGGEEICRWGETALVSAPSYRAESRSIVLLGSARQGPPGSAPSRGRP
ncbi:MAG: glycogen debranching protein GlgX [Candidatus Methylomirabilia bacterium]